MPEQDSSARSQLTDSEVDYILRRAVELEERGTSGLTISDVRRIASEIGVKTAFVDAAYSELLSASIRAPSPPDRSQPSHFGALRRWFRFCATTLSSGLLGMITRDGWDGYGLENNVAMSVVGISSLALAKHLRRTRDQGDYQLDNLALWLAYTAGWCVVNGQTSLTIVLSGGAAWLVSAALGGSIVNAGPQGNAGRAAQP